MHSRRRKLRVILFLTTPMLFFLTDANAASGTAMLVPRFAPGQTYSNVFSIMHALNADGYDEYVRRNGGSADYSVLAANLDVWRLRVIYRYYGQPGGEHVTEYRDAGRTMCALKVDVPADCEPDQEGTGLLYNPALWGSPPKRLTPGMTWTVDIQRPWELGGANGTQRVTVIRVDPSTDSVVLMREGTAEGFFGEDEPKQRQLTHGGQTETLDLSPGVAHWKGYATIVGGIIFSDSLHVTRDAVLRSKGGQSVHATETYIMLLNAAPFPTL
jgi:hypothetical protein